MVLGNTEEMKATSQLLRSQSSHEGPTRRSGNTDLVPLEQLVSTEPTVLPGHLQSSCSALNTTRSTARDTKWDPTCSFSPGGSQFSFWDRLYPERKRNSFLHLSLRRMEFGRVAFSGGQFLKLVCKVKNETLIKINLESPLGGLQVGGRHTGSWYLNSS